MRRNPEDSSMSNEWYGATRRLWVGVVLRTLIGGIVLSPVVASAALLFSHFVLGNEGAFLYISFFGAIAAHLLICLWATRQALQQEYPEGHFKFTPNARDSPPK